MKYSRKLSTRAKVFQYSKTFKVFKTLKVYAWLIGKYMPGYLIVIYFLLVINAIPIHAQVILDGTIGTLGKVNLPGPDYEIKSEFGQKAGANLFHSFQQFSISMGESATFSGPDSVQNIIARGRHSWIDGILRSSIADANLYLLNSAGVMFGPNAALDIGGSFHVSTGDYLRMGENERFYTMPSDGDLLSASAPSAFGFLDNDVAPVTIEGKGEFP